MNGLHCSFCEKPGQFSLCECGFGEMFRCSNHPACGKCKTAHKTIGVLFRGLLNSKMQERSNSLRRRLFSIVWSTFCENEFPEKRHILDTLGRTSAFSPNERNFQACVREAVRLLPDNPQILAGSVLAKIKEAAIERFFESCSELMEANEERDEQLSSFVAFAREVTARARLKKYIGL